MVGGTKVEALFEAGGPDRHEDVKGKGHKEPSDDQIDALLSLQRLDVEEGSFWCFGCGCGIYRRGRLVKDRDEKRPAADQHRKTELDRIVVAGD